MEIALQTDRNIDAYVCSDRPISCISSATEGAQKVILVAAYDSTVFVLSATSGLLIRILEGHTKTVFSLQVRTYQNCFLILITGKKKIWTLLMTLQTKKNLEFNCFKHDFIPYFLRQCNVIYKWDLAYIAQYLFDIKSFNRTVSNSNHWVVMSTRFVSSVLSIVEIMLWEYYLCSN